jgi:hypothetical protein
MSYEKTERTHLMNCHYADVYYGNKNDNNNNNNN